jgi:hypothetical protein
MPRTKYAKLKEDLREEKAKGRRSRWRKVEIIWLMQEQQSTVGYRLN